MNMLFVLLVIFEFSSLLLKRIYYLLNLFRFDVYHLLRALRSRSLRAFVCSYSAAAAAMLISCIIIQARPHSGRVQTNKGREATETEGLVVNDIHQNGINSTNNIYVRRVKRRIQKLPTIRITTIRITYSFCVAMLAIMITEGCG